MNDTINVSRADLRAELSALELRLVDRLSESLERKADHVVVEQLEMRVQQLEISRAERAHIAADISKLNERVNKQEKFRLAFPSIGAIMVLLGAASFFLEKL